MIEIIYQNGTTIGEPRNETQEFQSNSIAPIPNPLIPVNCERIILFGLIIHIQEKRDRTGKIYPGNQYHRN
jgi:hypothetical protein